MGVEEVELEGLEYMYKFKERLDIAMAYINDGRDITEDDYQVLFEIFKIQEEGKLSFYKTISTESHITTTQADLFSCETITTGYNKSDFNKETTTGTVVESGLNKQKNKKNGSNKKV